MSTGHPVCRAGVSSLGAGAGRQTDRSARTEAGRGGETQQRRLKSSRGHLGGHERAGGRKPSGRQHSQEEGERRQDCKAEPTRHQRPGSRGGGGGLKASPLSKAVEMSWP